MKKTPLNKTVLIGFSLLCVACLAGIALVLFDVVSKAMHSDVSGLGAVALFVMAVAFAARHLWENRQAGGD